MTAVPSSISNSDIYATTRHTARGNWIGPLTAASLLLIGFIAYMEMRLAVRGFDPSMVDNNLVWAEQRERASSLGGRALIIVGASRAQLDLDLDTLRLKTGLEPVQLALDASSILPVLQGLADDPQVTGTVLVDFQASDLASATPRGQSAVFEASWEWNRRALLPSFSITEARLTNHWRRTLRSYADGATPLSSLISRVLNPHPVRQYMLNLANRERMADYRLVAMPQAYLSRVATDLRDETGIDVLADDQKPTATVLEARIQQQIGRLGIADTSAFDVNMKTTATLVHRIQNRGGKVLFVEMPTSGLEHDLIERRYPRERFWDRFLAETGAVGLRAGDNLQLQKFTCPDGSHLDYRDQVAFTSALANAFWPAADLR